MNFIGKLISAVLIISLLSCTNKLVLFSKPSIMPDERWLSYERCGYRCKPMVDFFEGENISIRIESFNYRKTFTIFAIFICENTDYVTVNPNNAFVKLHDGRLIEAKARTPGFSKEESAKLDRIGGDYLKFLRDAQPLTGDLPLDLPYANEQRLYRPISFFFDVSPPHPSEPFYLHIEGLFKNGKKVDVPVIVFRPAIRDSGDGIPIEKEDS